MIEQDEAGARGTCASLRKKQAFSRLRFHYCPAPYSYYTGLTTCSRRLVNPLANFAEGLKLLSDRRE